MDPTKDPGSIHIGGQTRRLRFSISNEAIAEEFLETGTVAGVLLSGEDPGAKRLVACAAGAMRDPSNKSTARITPPRVRAWLEKEPGKYLELLIKCQYAAARSYAEKTGQGEEAIAELGKAFAESLEFLESGMGSDTEPPDSSASPPT